MGNKKRTFIDKCFKDKNGTVVVAQAPNYPILIWLICLGLQFLPLPVNVLGGIYYIGGSFLFLWAWLELYAGVNYFRKALGLIVLAMLIIPEFTR